MALLNIFTALPTSMPKLEAAVQRMDDLIAVGPPDITTIGERLRRVFTEARDIDYKGLSNSVLRKLPFSYWVDNQQELPITDPELVKRYWNDVIVEATRGNSRRAKRWLSPLFYVYCVEFDSNNEHFKRYAQEIQKILPWAEGNYAAKLKEMNYSFSFFNPNTAPKALASHLFESKSKSLEQALSDNLLWLGFVDTLMGQAVLESALNLSNSTLSDQNTIARLFDWVNKLSQPIHKSNLRVKFANAILEPWYRKNPPEHLKNIILEFFIRKNFYGDPRIEGHRQHQWRGVSQNALSTIFNWLTGDTLRGFMTILARTADQIWHYRKTFWMAYYERGLIDEAWLALGPDALREIRNFSTGKVGIGYGQLEGGIANNQSVLILRLGNIVFTEWSHSGSLRAFLDNSVQVPKLYQSSYNGYSLRAVQSLDFHSGANQKPELGHHHSDLGTWQKKARDFIRMHTGVYLSDREIL